MTTLLEQAPEVLHDIFCQAEPSDLASVARTCHFLNKFISRDNLLWRRQYLAHYDSPAWTDIEPEWQRLVKRNVSVQKVFESSDDSIKTEEELRRVAELADFLLKDSSTLTSRNTAFLRQHFANESNISSFLCRSSLFRGARFPTNSPASSPELRQLSAKLHVYSGLDLEPNCSGADSPTEFQQVHPYARSRVYDLRRYKATNHWGPFMDDGTSTVDWEKVQAIMLDLLYNVHVFTRRGGHPHSMHPSPGRRRNGHNQAMFASTWAGIFDKPFWGLAPNSFRSQAPTDPSTPMRTPPSPDLDKLDPYGVSGTWMRIVCFLDYSDLYNFNFNFDSPRPTPDTAERGPIDTREAFRLIKLHLHVTSVDEPGEDDHPDFPVVSFTGTSRSILTHWDPNANSRIRGTVRTTKSGDIRWTTFSIFHGEERWRSEGVQIGGIRSARGILGNWFDKDYDAAGPAGPTAFWKVSDDVVEEKKTPGQHLHGLQHQGWWANGPDEDSEEDSENDGEWVDEDEDGEGNNNDGGEGSANGGAGVVPGGGRPLTLADLGLLVGQGGGGGNVVLQGGGHGDGGLVLPLHQVLQLLMETVNGNGGDGGEITLDFEGLAEGDEET